MYLLGAADLDGRNPKSRASNTDRGVKRGARMRADRGGSVSADEDAAHEYGKHNVSPFRVFVRSTSLIVAVASVAFFLFGLFISGTVVFTQHVSAEDVTRGFDYGPIWLKEGVRYRARLELLIPESEVMWETNLSVLDRDKRLVEPETVFLNTTQPEFAPGKRTTRDNYFTLKGASGWHYFKFQQIGGMYPAPGEMSAPVAGLELREGVVEPKACFAVLIVGLMLTVILILLSRKS
jgi:hypothetical protein